MTPGSSLDVPQRITQTNSAGTFRPYNASETAGIELPAVGYIPPAPKASCNPLQIVMIVVAVVVTIYTAGAAAGVMANASVAAGTTATVGGAAGTGAFAAGTAVLSGSATVAAGGVVTAMGAGAMAASAAIGGFAGSVASQLVGRAMGVTDSFSLRQAVGSGLTAGLTAGAGAALSGASGTVGRVFGAGDWRSAAAYASVNTLTGHAGARMAGLDNSFSWRSVAANAVTAGISSSVTGRLGKALQIDTTTVGGQFGQDLLGGAVGGIVGIHTRRAAGMEQGVNYGQVAVDAFGNALANGATGEHSRRALAALESQHRADLINAELQGRLAEGELQGAALAQALGRMGLPSDPRAHDGLWDRLPADGSRVLLDQRQGSNANGTPWTEQDWARRINDSYERRRLGGARVDFNTVRTDGVRDRRPAQVEALPAFIAAPPRSPGWSLSQQIWLNVSRGTGAVVGVGKMFYDAAEGTVVGARTFAQAGMYQIGLAGVMDGWLGGNSYAMAGLQAGDRLGAGIQGLLDFGGSDYKGQIIADGIFSRFDDAAAKLSSQDPLTAFKGGIGIGQLTAEVGTSVYGGFQMARGGVGFAGRAADNFADLSKGKLYSLEGALGDVAKAAWDAALRKRSGGVADTTFPLAGFAGVEEFAHFGQVVRAGLARAGYGDVQPILQGSAVTGKSFRTGQPFDTGRSSDFDIALADSALLLKAENLGIGLRGTGTRTGPLTARDLRALGLRDLSNQLSHQYGREVNFMIYKSPSAAIQRAPSILLPTAGG